MNWPVVILGVAAKFLLPVALIWLPSFVITAPLAMNPKVLLADSTFPRPPRTSLKQKTMPYG